MLKVPSVHCLGLAGRDLQRGGLGLLVRLTLLGVVTGLDPHRDDADVLEDGLADPVLSLARDQSVGQNQVDPVTWKDQARIAGGRGDRHRDGAHARIEHGGEKAAVAGLDDGTVGDRLADGDAAADDGTDHLVLRPFGA
jgi:hypothetical protein